MSVFLLFTQQNSKILLNFCHIYKQIIALNDTYTVTYTQMHAQVVCVVKFIIPPVFFCFSAVVVVVVAATASIVHIKLEFYHVTNTRSFICACVICSVAVRAAEF